MGNLALVVVLEVNCIELPNIIRAPRTLRLRINGTRAHMLAQHAQRAVSCNRWKSVWPDLSTSRQNEWSHKIEIMDLYVLLTFRAILLAEELMLVVLIPNFELFSLFNWRLKKLFSRTAALMTAMGKQVVYHLEKIWRLLFLKDKRQTSSSNVDKNVVPDVSPSGKACSFVFTVIRPSSVDVCVALVPKRRRDSDARWRVSVPAKEPRQNRRLSKVATAFAHRQVEPDSPAVPCNPKSPSVGWGIQSHWSHGKDLFS